VAPPNRTRIGLIGVRGEDAGQQVGVAAGLDHQAQGMGVTGLTRALGRGTDRVERVAAVVQRSGQEPGSDHRTAERVFGLK
jgi:hypothetical protein